MPKFYHLERQKTGSTPYVLIDEKNGYMMLAGESFHENAVEFFREINDWLGDFLLTDFGLFTFDCKLDYFNSSTAKLLLNMFLDMDEHSTEANRIIINWYAAADDDIIVECGEDYKEDMENLEFNLVITE